MNVKTSKRTIRTGLLAALGAVGLAWIPGCGRAGGETSPESQEGTSPPPASSAAADTPLQAQIPDTVLTDQHGKEVHFYTDLVRGKRVLLNAIYTTCSGSCPAQTSIFTSVQKHLAKHPEIGDVQLISISLDPLTDKPARLAEFAEKYEAQPGWTFLTGSRENVREVLEAMDLYVAIKEQHDPICVLGNESTGVWMKMVNLATPREIVDRLAYVAKLDPREVVGGGRSP